MRLLVQKILEILVRIKLARTRPKIIGITGSFGKTTAKEAVYTVLKTRWRCERSGKSLNTEIGLLLAVLGQSSGFRSPVKWMKILAGAVKSAFWSQRADFLILEYGADKPGDIAHLVSVVRPDIAIITAVARVHQADGQFKNEEAVFEEKKILAESVPKKGMVILNSDDAWLRKLKGKLAAKIWWYGSTLQNDISASNHKNTQNGFETTIQMGTQSTHAHFPIAGSFHINSILPALLLGVLHEIPLEDGAALLANFHLPPGRMSIIPGKHETTLLDSSYNASPQTVKQALLLLKNFPGKRKIAVLGNMNELGEYTEKAHREVAHEIHSWLDQLVTVGEYAAVIADECLKNGFPKHKIKILPRAEAAADFLLKEFRLNKDDVILLKGSQNNVRLERAVKMLMAHPADAKKLLCRQEDEWEKI